MLKIITYPNEILRKKSQSIDKAFLLNPDTQKLILQMKEIMHQNDGVGLAAPQVGQNIRLCVIGKQAVTLGKSNDIKNNDDIVLINPVWEKTNRKKTIDVEGCLSVPKTYGEVKRSKEIVVKALDMSGQSFEFTAHDFLARVIQHEVDHLDGILFIDKAKGIYQVE